MLAVTSYKLPICISLLLHGAVISLFFVKWPEPKIVIEPTPQHVMAEVISVESAAEKERKRLAEQQRRQQQAAQRRAAEQQKREAAAKAAAAKKAQQEAQQKAQAEKLAQQAALKEQQQAEAQQQAEQRRVQQQQQAERELQEQLLAEQLAGEQKAQEQARKQAERAMAIEADYMQQIQQHVSSYWSYPAVVRPEEETELRITLVPTGQVIQVSVVKSSGNPALDRSVEQAVRKASPLPVPKDIHVFEKSFRNLTMKFRPENASW